ncbi:hypothetical protein E4U28_002827 [Claviceps purpurea]|nr:hypothetical protein E4U28_002827 [Claviceps purpurea]
MLEVLVGGASECCTSFYDTDGPQEPEVLHGSEGDVEASGRPTVGQFVKVGSVLLESGVCHLQVLRAPVRVEENQNEVLEYLCHRPESSSAVRCPGGIKVPRAHVRYPCPLRREPIFVDDVARILESRPPRFDLPQPEPRLEGPEGIRQPEDDSHRIPGVPNQLLRTGPRWWDL